MFGELFYVILWVLYVRFVLVIVRDIKILVFLNMYMKELNGKSDSIRKSVYEVCESLEN